MIVDSSNPRDPLVVAAAANMRLEAGRYRAMAATIVELAVGAGRGAAAVMAEDPRWNMFVGKAMVYEAVAAALELGGFDRLAEGGRARG